MLLFIFTVLSVLTFVGSIAYLVVINYYTESSAGATPYFILAVVLAIISLMTNIHLLMRVFIVFYYP